MADDVEKAPCCMWFLGTKPSTPYRAALKIKFTTLLCQTIFSNSKKGFAKLQ
jgi:hypothetical protein